MKKIVLIMLMGLSSLFANGFGVDVGTKVSKVNDKKILGIQSLKELVGDGGTEVFIEGFYKAGWAQIGTRYTNLSEEKDNKLELTWKAYLNENADTNFKMFINGGVGLGVQGSRTSNISTNITRSNYITASNLNAYKVPSVASIDSTTYWTVSIGLGVSYNFTPNFNLYAGYEFERKSMDLDYKVSGKTEKVSLSGVDFNSHGTRFGIQYRF